MAAQVVRNGTLIDGNGGEPVAGGMILVEDGKIAAAGRDGSFAVPSGAVEIDAGGGTILPGLIDTHVHITGEGLNLAKLLTTPFSYRFYETIGYMRKTLDVGITSIRDAGGADASGADGGSEDERRGATGESRAGHGRGVRGGGRRKLRRAGAPRKSRPLRAPSEPGAIRSILSLTPRVERGKLCRPFPTPRRPELHLSERSHSCLT